MQIKPLPETANLENFRKCAKNLLNAAKAKDHAALQRIGPYFGDPAKISLELAQLVLAREFGYSSWTKLKLHIENQASENSVKNDRLANQFLELVVIPYRPVQGTGTARFEQASALLNKHPDILTENIYTAAAVGDTDQIDRWLDESPGLINQKGGFYHWEPLMYATYARLPGRSTLAAALRLLEKGADPNAYYMSNGQYRFTALTGAFGHGEGGVDNQPEHPDYVPLCRALLQSGASPNDSQAAYNRGLGPDNVCLEMLIEFGLGARHKNNWLISEEDQWLPNPSDTMHFHLIQAIRRGFVDRAKLLIDNGVDIHKPDDTYETRTKGKTPLETALITGEREIADYLRANGAEDTDVSTLTLLQAACSCADSPRAQKLLEKQPALRQAIKPLEREMLCEAVNKGNRPSLELMIKLGFNLNDNTGRPPLHDAALSGNLDLVKLLINAGADPTLRDPDHLSPASGFAQHGKHDQVVEFLDTVKMDIFTAAARGNLEQLQARLEENPFQREMTFAEIKPSTKDRPSDNDWMTPLVFAAINNRAEAVRYLLSQGADPAVNDGGDLDLLSLLKTNESDAAVIKHIQSALEQP